MTIPDQGQAEAVTTADLLSVLTYFEMFRYPLTIAEIRSFLPVSEGATNGIMVLLDSAVAAGIIWQYDQFYMTKDAPEWIQERMDKNHRADRLLPKALGMGRFIGRFPFVRGVMISGSMSKHCMSADSDIDFFVVTEPGRLWLARTLLIMYKKIFLLNSRKYFCVNYFVDKHHLLIQEQNLFTAMECATLLPVYDAACYESFVRENAWVYHRFYPNFPARPTDEVPTANNGGFKKILERLLSGRAGSWLDHAFMRLTVLFWRRKFRAVEAAQFETRFRSNSYVSKHHPQGYQDRVLARHAERMAQLGYGRAPDASQD